MTTSSHRLWYCFVITPAETEEQMKKKMNGTIRNTRCVTLLDELQREPTPNLFAIPVFKDAPEVRFNLWRLAPFRCAGAHRAPPLLLPGFRWEGGEHGRALGPGVFFEVGVGQDFGGGGAGRRVQGEEGAEELSSGECEEGEFSAEDGAGVAGI